MLLSSCDTWFWQGKKWIFFFLHSRSAIFFLRYKDEKLYVRGQISFCEDLSLGLTIRNFQIPITINATLIIWLNSLHGEISVSQSQVYLEQGDEDKSRQGNHKIQFNEFKLSFIRKFKCLCLSEKPKAVTFSTE